MVAGRTCTIPCNCEEIQECKRQTINHGVISGTSRPARHQPRRKAWTLLIRSMQARLVYSIQSTVWPYQVIPCWALFGGLHWCDSNISAPAFFWLQGCEKSQLAFVIPCLMDLFLGSGPSGLLSFSISMGVYISFRLRLSGSEVSM